MPTNDPHFRFPFALAHNGASVLVWEQDADGEIEDCVEVLLTTERGERQELPKYGLQDLVFVEGGTDLNRLADAIQEWEDRADFSLEQTEFADFVERIRIAMQGGGVNG